MKETTRVEGPRYDSDTTDLPEITHWNYAMVIDESETITINEVYYAGDEILGWTGPTYPSGENEDELFNDMLYFMRAMNPARPLYRETGSGKDAKLTPVDR